MIISNRMLSWSYFFVQLNHGQKTFFRETSNRIEKHIKFTIYSVLKHKVVVYKSSALKKNYLVLTSGELEHSANNDTLLLPSIASRSISVATNNSSCSDRI